MNKQDVCAPFTDSVQVSDKYAAYVSCAQNFDNLLWSNQKSMSAIVALGLGGIGFCIGNEKSIKTTFPIEIVQFNFFHAIFAVSGLSSTMLLITGLTFYKMMISLESIECSIGKL